MEQLMRIVVFVGGVIGVIPFQSSLISTSLYNFKWFSLKTLYCTLGTGISAFINLDYILSNGMTYFKSQGKDSKGVPPSLHLISIVMIISMQFICVLVRILCLYNCPGFFKILRNIEQIRGKLSLFWLNSYDRRLNENNRRCTDGHKLGRIDAHCIGYNKRACVNKNNRRCKRIFFCLITFLAGFAVCLNQAMQIKNYVQMYMSGNYDSFWMPRFSPVLASCLEVIPDVCYPFIIIFAVYQIVILTLILLDLYAEFAHSLRVFPAGFKSGSLACAGTAEGLSSEIFELLKESLNLLNDVCGYNIVILITVWMVNLTWIMISFTVEGPSFGMTALLATILHFIIISGIGEHFKVEMRIAKENLESYLLLDTNNAGDTNEQMPRIIGGFLKWEWKLDAKGFYPVDHSLIPMVIAASFTYTIFVFQLRMAEY